MVIKIIKNTDTSPTTYFKPIYIFLLIFSSRFFMSFIRSGTSREIGSVIMGTAVASVIKFVLILLFAKFWESIEEKSSGNIAEKICNFILFVYFLIFAVYSALICTKFAVIEFYDKKLLYFYLAIFLFATFFVSLMGIPALIRGGFILFCLIAFAIGALVISVFPKLNFYNLLEFDISFRETAVATYENMMFSAEIITFSKLMKYTFPSAKKKDVFLLILSNFLASTIVIILVVAGVGTYAQFSKIPTFALAKITKGFFIDNVQALFFCIWVALGAIRTILMFNFSFEYFNKIDISNKTVKMFVFFLFSFITVIILNTISYNMLVTVHLCIFILSVVILPLIYITTHKILKKRGNKDV